MPPPVQLAAVLMHELVAVHQYNPAPVHEDCVLHALMLEEEHVLHGDV